MVKKGIQWNKRPNPGVREEKSEIKKRKKETSMPGLEPVEDLEIIILREDEQERTVQIGSQLDPLSKEDLIKLLKEYVDVFSFLATDSVGLSLEVSEHHLDVDPEVRPMKKRRRHSFEFVSATFEAILTAHLYR